MRDITLEDTFYHDFTTRAFATGIPTVLAGTPVLSVLEENNATPITAGVSLSVDRASVVGLNEATIVATAANGYEAGKSYSIYISTGTVDGVSVIGEVVGQFTIQASAAAVDLANGTDGLGALSSTVTSRTLLAADYFDPAADTVANVTTVATTTTNTDMRGTDSALLASSAPTNWSSTVISAGGSVDSLVQGYLNTALTETTAGRIAGNFDVFFENADSLTTKVVDDVGGGGGGTDWTTAEQNEIRGRLGITGTTAAGGNTPTLSLQATVDSVETKIDGVQGATFDTATDSLEAIRDRGDVAWITGAGGSAEAQLLQNTTIATLASQTSFTLTAGSGDDDAYNGAVVIVTDQSTSTQKAMGYVSDYTGATKTITLSADPGIFVMAVNDTVDVIASSGLLTSTQASIDAIEVDTSTSLRDQIDDLAIVKNEIFSNFEFLMVLTLDHVTPATGLVLTGQRSVDGAPFASVDGALAEVGSGIYKFDALAADTNGDVITWRFSAGTADDTFVTFKTVQA